MAFVAGISGFARGGKMLMNYTFGLIAFSFVDVALAIVQSISLFNYNNKMSDIVLSLGGNPYTASGIPVYLQEMAYMSGMMGLAAVIVVPLVVGVVFKGETAAAAGAYNSVMGKYKGDQGGQTALDSSSRAAATHASEAQQHEEAARRELGSYGINSVPRGVMASQYLDQISAQAAALSGSAGAMRVMDSEYGGDFQKFAQNRARAGMGTSMQKVGSEIGSGNGVLDAINGNSGSLGNFMHQAGSDAAAGFMAQAHKGALSKTEDRLSRENQIIASTGNAENDMRSTVAKGMGARKAFDDGMGAGFMKQTETDTRAGIESQEAKSKLYSPEAQIDAARVKAAAGLTNDVGTTKGLVASGAFDSKGGAGKEHGDYESGIDYQSRKQANQSMALGKGWSNMSEEAKSNLMGKVQTNTNVAEFGGIDATHAEIMEHGSAEQAKRDMVTVAQKKGIDATADANTLRSKFSDKKGGLDSGLVTKDEQDKFDARTKDLEESIAKDKLQNSRECNKFCVNT